MPEPTAPPTSTSTPNPPPEAHRAPPPSRMRTAERWALGGLMLLATIGIGIADFSATRGFQYWLAMVPVFAGVSLWLGWAHARARGENAVDILWRQLVHWATLALAVYVIHRLQTTGRLDSEDAGLMALLAVAVVTALAGLHFDWRLGVVGGLLGIATLAAAFVQQFFWPLLIVAVPATALLVLWRRHGG